MAALRRSRFDEDSRIHAYQNRLLQELAGYHYHLQVLNAFASVPRHCFMQTFYLPLAPDGDRPQWRLLIPSAEYSDEWLEAVYGDQPLITQLGPDGHASSSSSKPSVMAAMLDKLAVESGQKVLEIGTGTGWNAALLAALTGNPALVTTIDIDATLVQSARRHIRAHSGEGMTILIGDGREGSPDHTLYDRIIATGSYPSVPFAWIDQLAPGGLLVMNLKTWYVSMMLLICRDRDTGNITGRIIEDLQGEFMRLHGGEGVDHQINRSLFPREPIEAPVLDRWDVEYADPDLLTNEHFKFFVWLHYPQIYGYRILRKKRILLYYLYDFATGKRLQFNAMDNDRDIRGDEALWNDLQTIIDQYHDLQYPIREDFCFGCTETEQYFTYSLTGRRWPIAHR